MKKFVSMMIVVATLGFGSTAWAVEPCVIEVKVNGLVCDFCARALEMTFGKRDDVKDIAVDLDNGNVRVVMKEGRHMDEKELRQLITDSGYDVQSIDKEC